MRTQNATAQKLNPASPLDHIILQMAVSAICLLLPHAGLAQTQSDSQPPPNGAPLSQTIQPVNTTVIVEGRVSDDYLPSAFSLGSLDSLSLIQAPVSATVMTRDVMTDQVSRLLSDVVKNDASIGEDYAPVGYYGDYQIRGFTIDLATGLQINGLAIAGEQDVPLENKERVEFLKGIAGVESGITSAGGLINYVTKRPAMVKTVDLATDHRGTAFGAVDLGQTYGARKQFGLRANIAGESIKTYVESANGWRAVGATAADWKISDTASLKTDFEYQHKVERSVSGYQLLGGTVVPDHVHPSVMLGDQPWSKPNTFDAINASSRLDLNLPGGWHSYLAGSYSHSLIDDNVIYAYGCYYEVECDVPGGPAPYFFAPDGTYDIYDYRDPGERRADLIGEAIAFGRLKTGSITHDLVIGGSLFHREVNLPGAPGPNAPATVQDGAVYTYLGSENIYQPDISYPIESPELQAGPLQLADFNRQASGIVQDRITLFNKLRLTAGGRYASVTDFNYSGTKGMWLPQYSTTYSPLSNLMLYGSYSAQLSLGQQAPFWADNGSEYLAPYITRQAEIGAKFEPGSRILFTTAFFHMRAPFFYPKLISAPDLFCTGDVVPDSQCFESDGRETHDGIELGAQGKAANWLRLSASAAGINAESGDTGTQAFDGKQVINVPRVKVTAFANITLPRVGSLSLSNLHLMPGWSYTDRKEATRDDLVSVPGYNLFNLGASYTPGGEPSRISFHLYADNIFDKRYWKDTGASYGDTFIHLGAPTTIRLSSQYRF